MKFLTSTLSALWVCLSVGSAWAGPVEDTIQKTLQERIPQFKKIDGIQTTPMPGLYEIRMGDSVFYSDAKGDYVIQGELIDTIKRRNLTEDRLRVLTAVNFQELNLKDAIKFVHGKGERQMAVFEDPNCGYCKRFERDLQTLDNATVYVFLVPILSPDSEEKVRNIWCAKDRAATWHNYMLKDVAPPTAQCDDSATKRNLTFINKHRITGTPTLILADNSRVVGAVPVQEVDQLLTEAHQKK